MQNWGLKFLLPPPRHHIDGDKFERDFGREGLSEQDAEKLGHLVQGLHRLDTGLVGKRADKIKALVEANMEKCGITAKDLEGIWNSRGGYGMLLLTGSKRTGPLDFHSGKASPGG